MIFNLTDSVTDNLNEKEIKYLRVCLYEQKEDLIKELLYREKHGLGDLIEQIETGETNLGDGNICLHYKSFKLVKFNEDTINIELNN